MVVVVVVVVVWLLLETFAAMNLPPPGLSFLQFSKLLVDTIPANELTFSIQMLMPKSPINGCKDFVIKMMKTCAS